MIREHAGEPSHVLVLDTLGVPQRRLLSGRRPRSEAAEPEPEPVPTARVTLVGAVAFDEAQARAWLEGADPVQEAEEAVVRLNRVLHAHRVATADGVVREVAADQALAVRVGIGEGEDVARGRWTEALRLPAPRVARADRRPSSLRPQERLAALLAGRDAALACEELTIRARTDLDNGRPREAALQLRVALEAALAELAPWSGRPMIAERLDELRDARGAVGAAANAALQGGLDEPTIAEVDRITGRIEAALRARVAAGFD